MNLTSCDQCGVILDMDKLRFAKDIENEDDSINVNVAEWHEPHNCFRAFVPCPVCMNHIVDTRG